MKMISYDINAGFNSGTEGSAPRRIRRPHA